MQILFDLGHPAHFHLFKNFIAHLKASQHTVVITTREKDVTNQLLAQSGHDYISLSKASPGWTGKLLELVGRDWKIFQLHRKHRFDCAFGTSTSIGHLSLVSQCKSFLFNQDDDDIAPFFQILSYPFVSKIINPDCLPTKKYRSKRVRHPSYHELAYLHPDHFSPDASVLKKYGLEPRRFVIARKSALRATHDVLARGIHEKLWEDIRTLTKPFAWVTSSETDRQHTIDPSDMHHVLAFAKLLVSDSQTMTREAVVLGVPSVRISSFVGRLSSLEEMEHRYGLTFGFQPNATENILKKIDELCRRDDADPEWRRSHGRILSDKTNLNDWMIAFFNREMPGS